MRNTIALSLNHHTTPEGALRQSLLVTVLVLERERERERESLLAQILNNFIQIKGKALGHRKKPVKQVVSSGAPRQFHKYLLWCKFDGRIIANLLRLLF